MHNPIFEDIAAKHGISAGEAEALMSDALSNAGAQVSAAEFLYALSEVLLSQENNSTGTL